MSTAVALPVQTVKLFLGNIDRQHVETSTTREVPSRTQASAIPAARGSEGKQQPPFLTALLRSLSFFAA
jgi:hypothetical protein